MTWRNTVRISCIIAVLVTLPLRSYAGFFGDVLNAATQGVADSISITQGGQDSRSESRSQEGSFAIGDEHGGGIIFYLDDSAAHGLIASDTDIRGTRSWDEATRACKTYKRNGFNDWFLPDREQLAELYLRRSVVGGWADKSAYWSSSESDIGGCAWLQYFSTGNQYRNFTKNYLHYARCVRSF